MANSLDINGTDLLTSLVESITSDLDSFTICETREELEGAIRDCIIGQLDDYSDKVVEAVTAKVLEDHADDFALLEDEDEDGDEDGDEDDEEDEDEDKN